MDEARLELSIAVPGALPVRVEVAKRITSVGSSTDADVRLASAPEHWLVLHRDEAGLAVREVTSGVRHRLDLGEILELGGVVLGLEAAHADLGNALDEVMAELAGVESAGEALELILGGVIRATGADTGALIVTHDDAYTVAAARAKDGSVLADAAELLSDTIVRDVLGSGERICLSNIGAHDRYARIPSVTALRLRSVVCVPMRLEGKTLGAIFLGKRDRRGGFGERVAAELKVLSAMAMPFLAQLRRQTRPAAAEILVGDSAPMADLKRLIARVAPSDLSVLIQGPSGSGKELVARAIHGASPRAARPLIALNCAAVPESLLAAELFGSKRGAFTGSTADRVGLVEAADQSTLFLDEVGDMPLAMQAALLRVLEQREVTRVGETQPRRVDFRLIAATHRDLAVEVAAGRFREDLRFRLKEMTLWVPALRERGDDILLLAHCFLRQAEAQLQLVMHHLGDEASAALRAHPWPGNVRELRATMRRAAILADDRRIRTADLGLEGGHGAAPSPPAAGQGADGPTRPLAEARDAFVKDYVLRALARVDGNREAAAHELGIGLRTLYRYLEGAGDP